MRELAAETNHGLVLARAGGSPRPSVLASRLGAAVALLALVVTCGHGDAPQASAAEASAPAAIVLSLVAYSGRENPPPQTTSAALGAEVTVHIEGLGPPRARVVAPDGTETPTVDVGKDQRFTASARGKYRIELAGAAGAVLAYVNVP